MKTKTLLWMVGLPAAVVTANLTALNSAEPAAATAPAADPYWPADGVFPVAGKTSSWIGFRAKNVERRALFAQRQSRDRNSIVMVGDSILEGWHTMTEDMPGLGVKLANRGIGGDTTPNLVYRLQDDVLSLNPRGLVILIGTNDLGEHTSPEQIANNLAELHRRIRTAQPDVRVAWCLVMPRGAEDDYPARIRDLNQRITTLAKSDPLSTVCDTYTPVALPDGSSKPECFLADRLHPNAAGFAAMKSAIYPVLQSWKTTAQ